VFFISIPREKLAAACPHGFDERNARDYENVRIFRQFSSLSAFPFHELEDLRSKTRCLRGFAEHRLQVAGMKKKKTLLVTTLCDIVRQS